MKKIPISIQEQARNSVEQYNQENQTQYLIRFRGRFAYLDRMDKNVNTQIGRLTYDPQTQKWAFAVYKYSSEKYDPDEWMFPGRDLLDGTIEGAMNAGMHIYPPSPRLRFGCNPLGCLLVLFLLPIRIISLLLKKLFKR